VLGICNKCWVFIVGVYYEYEDVASAYDNNVE